MRKVLFLVRHAATKLTSDSGRDFDRTLKEEGHQEAIKLGHYLKQQGLTFQQIVASPAKRTKTTVLLIAEQLGYDIHKIVWNEQLYNASVGTVMGIVNQLDERLEQVMIVGHNPSITYTSEYLTERKIQHVPTCGFVHINFWHLAWAKIAKGMGELALFKSTL
ncbi:MAG: histidine phosphatase family protein [Cytophagales bacterium]|nr:histidine phosphatase family protein [Cytophagales bacterium]